METLNDAAKLSAFNYITKPFNDKQLIASVNRFFASKVMPATTFEKPTPREMNILQLIANGLTSKEIASSLNLSFHTIETHRKNLLRKYNVSSMMELVCLATAREWIEYKRNN